MVPVPVPALPPLFSGMRQMEPEDRLDARKLKKIQKEQTTLEEAQRNAEAEEELLKDLPF